MPITSEAPLNAVDFLGHASGMLRAAEHIAAAGKQNLINPFYLLIGQSLELSLNAFLIHKGRSIKELQHSENFGHHLDKLLAAAQSYGLLLGSDAESLIEAVSEPYARFFFRYPRLGATATLHKPPFALAMTDHVLGCVAETIGWPAREGQGPADRIL